MTIMIKMMMIIKAIMIVVVVISYHSVQNLLYYTLLSKNLKIKIYRSVILPVFCMGLKLGG